MANNRILFTSGSNNFLGIRAYQVQDTFKVPAINMSIHAGLTTDYILDRLKRTVKSGDMVIVPFEYSNFTYNGDPSIVLNKYLLTYDKDYFESNYSFVEKLKILSSISLYDLLYSLLGTRNHEGANSRVDLLKNLNQNGDMLNVTEHDSLKTKKNPFDLPNPINLESRGLKAIKAFNDYCNDNKIAFFVTFPNLVYDKVYESEKYQNYFKFLSLYFDKHQIDVLGSPLQAMYPRRLFFDSEYHLISEGSDLRTADFIKILNQNLKVITKLNAMRNDEKLDIQ
jgi:hypothetical protein